VQAGTLSAAIFDMDGLLIDSEPLWQDAEMEVFGEVGVPLTRAQCSETKGRRVDDTVAYWYARKPWSGPSQSEVEARLVRRVTALIRARGVAKPGADHALRFFRERECALALATSSGRPVIDAVLARLGLGEAFRVVHSAVEEPKGKPDPAVYLTTAQRLGIAPSRCVALEDSAHGVAAAKAAGMACIAVPDAASLDSGVSGADVVLASLLDLDAAIWRKLTSCR
jgi:sugar-phosphatase